MTFRTTSVLAATIAGLLATGVQAQVRTEPTGSVFVWEALGATPSLQLKRLGATTGASTATGASRASVRAPASPAALNELTDNALGATPHLKQPDAARTAPSVATKVPAAPKDAR